MNTKERIQSLKRQLEELNDKATSMSIRNYMMLKKYYTIQLEQAKQLDYIYNILNTHHVTKSK